MAKKRKNEKPKRVMTKRQLSHWQQTRKRQRIILISGIITVAAVLILTLSGYYITTYRPIHQPVIRVNGVSYDMGYYIELLKIRGKGQSAPVLQYLAPTVAQEIERNELVKQEAAKLGIIVSGSEVKQQLKDSKLPNEGVYIDMLRTQMLVTKLKDEYFEKQVPTEAEQVNAQAMLLESEKQADEVRSRLEKGEDFAALAGELSLDTYTKTNKGSLGWHPQNVLSELLNSKVPGDYAFGSVVGTLSQPRSDTEVVKQLGYWLIKVTDRKDATNEAQVYAMLLSSEAQAQDIKKQLEAGGDFATLAKENSQLQGAADNGGNMGLVTKDTATKAFEDYVFNPDTKLNAISNPIPDNTMQTTGGYWLVKVLEKADKRQVDAADRDMLKSKAVNDWVASLWYNQNYQIENLLDDAKTTWAINQVTKA